MAVGLSTANLAHAWLNTLKNTSAAFATTAVKLHTGDPGASGTTAASATTTRMAITWGTASGGSLSMSGTLSWTSWAGGSETISHISIWDSTTAGNFLASAALTASKAVTNGDTLNLTTLTIALTPLAA